MPISCVQDQSQTLGDELSEVTSVIDKVRASRAGHTFHERWTARRALQPVFPKDDLFAIAVDGVKLVLTARQHRMDDVIGKSQVERFELRAFSEDETRRFL